MQTSIDHSQQKKMDEKSFAESPTLSRPLKREVTVARKLKGHFSNEVTTVHADILLLSCCLISGLVDSTVYQAYGTFVSMQTVLI